MSSLRVGVGQLTSTEDITKNSEQIVNLVEQTLSKGPVDFFCFPENSLFFRVRKSSITQYLSLDELSDGPLQKAVALHKVPLMLTTPLMVAGQRANATLLFENQKRPQVLYQKIHLFDVDVPGAPPVKESDHFQHGEKPFVWQFKDWKIGLTICYDLRFSELFLHYAKASVDGILVPSAFLVPTGQAHWHTLLRARAIESQCYVVAPAQMGEHVVQGESRQTYGHSLAVDPWGRVLVDLEQSPSMAVVQWNKEEIQKVRRQIPMQNHRRL